MSKRWIGIVCMLGVMFGFLPFVQAQCDYEIQNNLRTKAGNVTANSLVEQVATGEIIEMPIANSDGKTEKIEEKMDAAVSTIYNITEDLYITVRNLNTSDEKTYYYRDTDHGTFTWQSFDLTNIVPYEIKIFSNHTDCYGEELAKLRVVAPKRNLFASMPDCYGLDTYYCKMYITEDLNMTEEQFKKLSSEAQLKLLEGKEKENKEEIKDLNFLQKYRFYILGGIIIMGVIIVVVIVVRKQRSKVL